jgi:hypothetical protein
VEAVPGETDRSSFCEVIACSDGRTAIAVGSVRTPDGSAGSRAGEARRLLGGWMGHGLEPAASLDALREWGSREGAELTAVLGIVDVAHRCVTYAAAGHALVGVLAGGTRYVGAPIAAAPAGAPSTESAAVVLAGDRVVIWAGDAPGLAAEGGPAFVRSILAGVSSPVGSLVGGLPAGGVSRRGRHRRGRGSLAAGLRRRVGAAAR